MFTWSIGASHDDFFGGHSVMVPFVSGLEMPQGMIHLTANHP
jgi:hypothetical protein